MFSEISAGQRAIHGRCLGASNSQYMELLEKTFNKTSPFISLIFDEDLFLENAAMKSYDIAE